MKHQKPPMSAEAESARIRQELLDTPGTRLCGVKDCQVITQGGPEGLRQHQQVVHFNDQWLRGDRK